MLTSLGPLVFCSNRRDKQGKEALYGYANGFDFACAWPLAHAACTFPAVDHRSCDWQRTPHLSAVQRSRQSVGKRACRAWRRPRGSRRDYPSELARAARDLLGLREAWRRHGAFITTSPPGGLPIVTEWRQDTRHTPHQDIVWGSYASAA